MLHPIIRLTIVLLVLLLPLPIPKSIDIQKNESPDKTEVVSFYWKGAGILSYLTEENVLVYMYVSNRKTNRDRIYEIKSTSPCDGVNTLRQILEWKIEGCNGV